MNPTSRLEHLSSPTCSVVVDITSGIPAIHHWGSPLDPVASGVISLGTDEIVRGVAVQSFGAVAPSSAVSVVPLHGDGHAGRPGLMGHRRGGRHWSPRFVYLDHHLDDGPNGSVLTTRGRDEIAELTLTTRLELNRDGVLLAQVTITNVGDSPYMLDALSVSFAVPSWCDELGVYSGRWAKEFQLQKMSWPPGAWTAENWSGRTSHEHPPYLWASSAGAGEWQGHTWGVHLAWSGNHVLYAETLPTGQRSIQCGELFHPGEICIDPGQSHTTPAVVGVYSQGGLTPASWGYHRLARLWSPRPDARPRPVHINTWEAVYFNHDPDRLRQLAEVAAEVGIERFVLDDGWFGGRRHDRAGLGDWTVSADVYPDGLQPLIDHVNELGMEFGIWVEPEMVNPDSDLYRQHPEWALDTDGYEPILGRHQLVLDLTNDEAWQHIFQRLDALLSDHRITYVKWDMNRPLIQASTADGKAASHAQTVAVHRLFDAIRERHPQVEFESCASGGGRIDHAMLQRVERVWTSDSNDALERQLIQRGASMVIPPEVMGSHIGPSRSHTTQRRHSLSWRGATALFGHLGVEWDITAADENEREQLGHIIGLYKTFRDLLHHGDTVRFDTFDITGGASVAHGVYSPDRRRALICYAQLGALDSTVPSPLRLPDLLADTFYDIEYVPLAPVGNWAHLAPERLGPAVSQPEWIAASIAGSPWRASGAVLGAVGLPLPTLWPESAVLVHLSCS